MKQLSVMSRQPLSIGRRLSFILVLFLLAIHCPLTSSFGDEIRSRAAIVMEASTGRVLYGKNPNLKLPPASTTKLMTAMVTLDRLDLNDVVTISEKAAGVSPIKANFRPGERVTVKTLLYAALLRSANDAAYALSEAVAGSEEKFAELMNEKVLALGMSDTVFANATGLPGGRQYTTVHDLSRLMRHALRYPTVREIINTKASHIETEEGRTIFLKNINKLLWEDDAMVGGKTGYTRAAKHCFVCAGSQENETIIAAILGAPSRETLWKESEALLAKGFAVSKSQEEPVIYFTQSDYRAGIEKASYSAGSSEIKKVSYKKTGRKGTKKAKRGRSKGHAKKQKRSKNNDIVMKGPDGSKG
ncbi:MAG TPA: D-alanyl-D-alanine carboxypeptidase family protein [Thermodesulfovibrionales bacterium]|nr:D-alanyl-D-alanine carboxypeptidase family protein [Thermodesulfovibrionales bacterium]